MPFFFFNDTATTEIYTLSLHDALPISDPGRRQGAYRDGDQALHEPRLRRHRQRSVLHGQDLDALRGCEGIRIGDTQGTAGGGEGVGPTARSAPAVPGFLPLLPPMG